MAVAGDRVQALAGQRMRRGHDALPERGPRVLRRIAARTAISRGPSLGGPPAALSDARVAGRVAQSGGSRAFIRVFGAVLTGWVALNARALTAVPNACPFVIRKLIPSMVAAFQAPVTMMSQNQHGENDRLTAAQDDAEKLRAEPEIMRLHAKIDAMRRVQPERLFAQNAGNRGAAAGRDRGRSGPAALTTTYHRY